ncbi:MAG: DUF5103 domain-containing protein [Paludibacteraceae bacterium]
MKTPAKLLRHTFVLCALWLCSAAPLPAELRTLRVRLLADAQAEENGERPSMERPFLWLDNGIVDGQDENNTLEISFDEMSHDVHFYTYTVLHLNADGSQSALVSSEYLRGFTTLDITDYQHSVNTQRDYTHYRFTFPNEDMQLTVSGLYAIQIYEDGDRENTVARIPFAVADPQVAIEANAHSKTIKELNGHYQQLDIDVAMTAVSMRDPQEFTLIVEQNGRTDNRAVITQPTFVENKRLRYLNNPALVFEGGNEYHHFDAYSAYYAGTGIDRIAYDNRDYHAILFPDTPQEGVYMHAYDVNGQFRVNAERTDDPDTEAEYMWVHWLLQCDRPWFDGTVYVGGDLFGNQLTNGNRMTYDNQQNAYYLISLVKQGGYDYQYWFLPKGSRTASTLRTDGSYWQTQNEYTIYVFYRPFGARADQLVGLQRVVSNQ